VHGSRKVTSETPPLFGKTRFLQGLIDEFIDKISEGTIYQEIGVKAYLEAGTSSAACEEKLGQIVDTKEHCAELRRRILTLLYTEMLIPDARGDVLRLLVKLFDLLDEMGDNYEDLIIEHHEGTHLDFREDFEALNSIALKCVRAVIAAARTFFRDPPAVRDHISEVRVLESETDKFARRLKKKIYTSDLSYERKTQLRDVTNMLENLADMAENLGDELAIFALKRAL
jgi:predicted phosphate transport protein (TIGR00153 family)